MDPLTARRFAGFGRRALAGLALAVLVGLPGLALATGGESGTAARPPKVVVVVGPAGAATDLYRRLGHEAAEVARRSTPDVTEIASPDATWPVVRDALQGADVVLYLGHGNGWPSPYRDQPYPQTQNGLGLNPIAGGDDDAHQYFGEAYLRASVRLAPRAVVVLSHLCYASGNSEPGDPEPSRDVAIQRADNFAAGWLAVGAEAVIADARLQPAFYLRRLLDRRFSPPRIWLGAPSARGHTIAVASSRTPGAAVLLDPDDPTGGGWFRSLVTRSPGPLPGVSWLGDPVTSTEATAPWADPLADALLRPVIGAPQIVGGQAPAAAAITIRLPIGWRAPLDVLASIRWVPLELDPWLSAPAEATGPVGDGPSVPPAAEPTDRPQATDWQEPPEPATGATRAPFAPSIVLVAPEEPSKVVEPARPMVDADGIRLEVVAPDRPGRYRLVVTLHRPDGTALPAEVQARIPSSVVRVTATVSVAFALPAEVQAAPGQVVAVPVAIRNSGSIDWGGRAPAVGDLPPRGTPEPPRLVATWVGLAAPWTTRVDPGRVIGPLRPGEEAAIVLLLRAPETPGPYLLLVDIDSPDHGSLVAAGSEPGLARVLVLDGGPTPAPSDSGIDNPTVAPSG